MPARAELEGAAIVLKGDFNPKIFQPAWLAANNLIRAAESDAAEIQVVHHDLTQFSSDWLTVQVLPEQFHASASDIAHAKPLCDLVQGIFTLLEHTPVKAMGVNRLMHFRLDNAEKFQSFGDMLAPKQVWDTVLTGSGLVSQTIRGTRPGKPSKAVRVKVESSVKITPNGVYVEVNEHFAEENARVSHFVELLSQHGMESLEFGKSVAEHLLSQPC